MLKKKVVLAQLIRRSRANDSFDLRFWRKVGVQGRWEAAWKMVEDLAQWKGARENQQRLRKSVATLAHR